MKTSVKTQLSLAVMGLALLTAMINAVIAFYDILHETHEFQDDLLQQVASYVDPQSPTGIRPSEDDDARLFVQTSAMPESEHILTHIPATTGFYNTHYHGEKHRYYVQHSQDGYVIVMQNSEYREELAWDTAWDNTVSFLLLIPLLGIAMVWIIRRKMRPVEALSQGLNQRTELDLTPLPTANVPSEIEGFVASINRQFSRTSALIEQQQRFIADAAHELRSPMTALSLQAERLASQHLPEQLASQITAIRASIQRNRHLIEQLLTLARAQSTNLKPVKTPLTSQAIFSQIIADLYPLAAEKAQDLGVASHQNVAFYANEMEIYTLIKTLVDNAIRYTPNGSQIDLSVSETQDCVIFSVEDDGFGISVDERERVLDPFYRVLGNEQQGTGLGLSIAQTIAKRYGGNLVLADSPNFVRGLLVQAVLAKTALQTG